MNMATKTARYFTVIALLMMTLSLFPPFSAMGSREEATTSSCSTATTSSCSTATIVTNQDGSSENGTSTSSSSGGSSSSSSGSSSSSIIDKTQDLTQGGIESRAEEIEERVDELTSSTTSNTTPVQLSGKIASPRINLNNGNVEQVLFGDWSVNVRSIGDASFAADFSARSSSNSSNNEEDAHYRIGNLKLNTLSRANENIAVGGTVDVTEEKGARTWEKSPVTILLINNTIVIGFEQQELNEVFSSQPIIGVVAAASQ
jgi:hypothetical protein